MKRTEIFGENDSGEWTDSRTGCRAVILKDGRILLSCESKTGIRTLPGGGLEGNESAEDCCIREIAEETGVLVRPTDCFLEIDEYYGDRKWISFYFLCEIVGETSMRLTAAEQARGMEPKWVDLKEAEAVFAAYSSYAGTDEDRRGMYLREHTALLALEELMRKDSQ